jgi:hypothetical protein
LWQKDKKLRTKRRAIEMREYKGLKIPDRHPRTDTRMNEKRINYCQKSNCLKINNLGFCNEICLFHPENINLFKEWYLSKNKNKKESN